MRCLARRLPIFKARLPGKIEMAGNLAKALAAHVADGLGKVTTEDLQARLEVCTLCPQRRDDRCSVCGCYLAPKAAMRSSDCPLGLWPILDISKDKAA